LRREACLCAFGLGALLTVPGLQAALKDSWQPVAPEELANSQPALEPDAAAEALFWKIDVDESDFPDSRIVSEYWRYKVFDPEKADRILHLSQPAASYNGEEIREVEMSARLTLPDGTVKIFGDESVHERDVIRNAGSGSLLQRIFGPEGFGMKEKFLAIGEVEPGSILEFKLRIRERFPQLTVFRPLQMESVPIRELEYVQHMAPDEGNFVCSVFVLNKIKGEVTKDKSGKKITFTAHDLPALHDEPFAGAESYYALTLVSCYTHTRFVTFSGSTRTQTYSKEEQKEHPWAPFATITNWLAEDHITHTRKVKQLAAELTQGAASDLEKAQRIHDYVQQLHQRFLHQPRKKLSPNAVLYPSDMVVTTDQVIDFEKEQPLMLRSIDFLWLAISLDRAAGLDAEVLMLPNRNLAPFDEQLVSFAFLQDDCAAIRIGEAWHFSLPTARVPLAFDTLPAEFEGQGGLLAREGKQDFIEVPFAPPEQSVVKHTGTFSLNEDGALSGDCQISFTGHSAYMIRSRFRARNSKGEMAIAKKNMEQEFDGAEVRITGIANADEPDKPLEFSGDIQWPGFATVAGNRLIIRPFVFRANSPSPFSATERRNPVYFPFKWQEADQLTIALPAGYEIETKFAPASHPGKILSHHVSLGYNAKKNILYVRREFSSALISASTEDYPSLKQWYDAVTTSDQHQMVLVKTEKPPATRPTASAP
jgi:hypothetical protein